MREPWASPVPRVAAPRPPAIWEENFQDLSDWCSVTGMQQARCGFPTGESALTVKLTGDTWNEGSSEITVAEGLTRSNTQTMLKNKGPNGFEARRTAASTACAVVAPDILYPLPTQYQQQLYLTSNGDNLGIKSEGGVPRAWVEPKVEAAIGTDNVAWQFLGDLGIAPTNQQADAKPETQDVLQDLETGASGSFDLLSYLCEDDIPSPGDSVSTDSSQVTEPTTQAPSSSSQATAVTTSLTIQESVSSRYRRPLRSSSSAARAEQGPSSPIEGVRRGRPRRARLDSLASGSSGHSRKRRRSGEDSDSDEDAYRETRERNNEASRKSRMNKKAKEAEMARRALDLERDNRVLRMKVDELEKLVSSMRSTLLRSALKRNAL